MRQTVITNCEKEFLLQSFLEDTRIDGRKCEQYRMLKVTLGVQRGSCFVELGNTKVFANVSAEIVVPKNGRPSAGEVYINVEMSPMAAPNFEAGRLFDRGIETTRMLERLIKESTCLDVESLCIIAGEKVWQIRIDVHVIDHDGAILDCASIASVCALKSFRRPDVTIVGESFILHSVEEKEPVPLNMFHTPVCMTFGLTEHGTCITVDPTEREEHVFEGEVVVAMNSHKELCAVHCTGGTLLQKSQILRCTSMATRRAREITELLNEVFQKDTIDRSQKKKVGFSSLINRTKITSTSFAPVSSIVDVSDEMDAEVSSNELIPAISKIETIPIKKKGKVVQIGLSPSPLMTQAESDHDDEIMIISEIRDAKPSVAPSSSNHENVENKRDLGRKTRAKVRKEKNKEVLQLLMDIEDDAAVLLPDAKKTDSDNDIEIVDEVNLSAALKKDGGRQKRRQKFK